MEKQLTLATLKGAEESLGKLLRLELPVQIAFKLRKFLQHTSTELNILEETRISLIKTIGVQENGNWSVPQEKVPEFIEKFKGALEITVTLDVPVLTLADLGTAKLTAQDMIALEFMIEE